MSGDRYPKDSNNNPDDARFTQIVTNLRDNFFSDDIVLLDNNGNAAPAKSRTEIIDALISHFNSTVQFQSQTLSAYWGHNFVSLINGLKTANSSTDHGYNFNDLEDWAGNHIGHWISANQSAMIDNAYWSPPMRERIDSSSGTHYAFQPVVWFDGNSSRITKRGFNQAHVDIKYVWGWDPKEIGQLSTDGLVGAHFGLTFRPDNGHQKYILWLTNQFCFLEGIETGSGASFKKFSVGIGNSGGSITYMGQGRWTVNRDAVGTHRGSWIGQEEAHYFGLQWHLDIPQTYSSEFNAAGPSPVTVYAPQNIPSPVQLSQTNRGGTSAIPVNAATPRSWITDLERTTGRLPSIFGFDYGRVTEVFYDSSNVKKEIYHKSRANRVGSFDSSERNLLKDLVLSTLKNGSEVTISYHSFNPWIPQGGPGNLKGHSDIAPMLEQPEGSIDVDQTLQGSDIVGDHDNTNPDDILKVWNSKIDILAADLKEWLIGSASFANDKIIYIRPFHETNGNFFWWGRVDPDSDAYHRNFKKLWVHTIDRIKDKVSNNGQGALLGRLKFVLSFNHHHTGAAGLRQELLKYFFVDGASDFSSPLLTDDELSSIDDAFIRSVDMIGLDYYEDNLDEHSWLNMTPPSVSNLYQQYQVIYNLAGRLGVDHALTEVGINGAKLYNDVATRTPRHFFNSVVYETAKEFQPKWVLLWANRMGHTAVTAAIPSNNDYDTKNVFTDSSVEIYLPAHARNLSRSGWNLPNINNDQASDYQEVIRDFDDMVTREGSNNIFKFSP